MIINYSLHTILWEPKDYVFCFSTFNLNCRLQYNFVRYFLPNHCKGCLLGLITLACYFFHPLGHHLNDNEHWTNWTASACPLTTMLLWKLKIWGWTQDYSPQLYHWVSPTKTPPSILTGCGVWPVNQKCLLKENFRAGCWPKRQFMWQFMRLTYHHSRKNLTTTRG